MRPRLQLAVCAAPYGRGAEFGLLFVRGWHEFEAFLLIRKTGFATPEAFKNALTQILFDGYSIDYTLLVANYYQITPWGMMTGFPEPAQS